MVPSIAVANARYSRSAEIFVAAIESLGVGDGPPRKEVTIDDMEMVEGS